MLLLQTATQGRRVFCRLRHSTSSCLQLSSPKPVTNTSSHVSALCASGAAAASFALALSAARVEAFEVLAAVPDTPDSDAPRLLTCDGTPVAAPPKLMLSRPMT